LSKKVKSTAGATGTMIQAPSRPAHLLAPDQSQTRRISSSFRTLALLHVVQTVVVLAGLYYALRLDTKDLTVPFAFVGDACAVLSNVTAVLQTGWFWHNPLLSAPFSYPIISIPANPSVDFAVVWIFARFSSSPGLILNLTWMSFFVIGAGTAFYCARQLQIPPSIAMICGTVYAFLPYGFYRNIGHFILSYYLVPFVCALALLIAAGSPVSRRFRLACFAGCGLVGLNYLYTSFFSIILLSAALLIAVLNRRPSTSRRLALTAIVTICAAIVLNLAPSLIEWRLHGKPFEQTKSTKDTEIYGLKIRHLISPIPGYQSGPFRAWTAKEQAAAFPLENENSTARLGIVPTIGFLLLLLALLVPVPGPQQYSDYVRAAAHLNICMLLVACVGGLSTLWSLFVSPDIRAYNRMVVFIAFFAVCAIGWALTRISAAVGPVLRMSLTVVVLAIAIFDQSHAAIQLLNHQSVDQQAAITRDVVRRIERQACRECMIYQMPETPFPVDPGVGGLETYEHGRPHIFSASLRWSWPASSLQRKAWQATMPVPMDAAIPYLRTSGFSLIWLDRRGYSGPKAVSPEAELTQLLGPPVLTSADDTIAVFDLRKGDVDPADASALARNRERLLNGPTVNWASGFYGEDIAANGGVFRWSQARSTLRISNPTNEQMQREMAFFAQSAAATPHELVIDVAGKRFAPKISAASQLVQIPLTLPPKATIDVNFSYNGEPLAAPGDSRQLAFAIGGFRLQ
jgi:phosphoglycerol transferase